jgi:hypothetical protein
MVEEIRHPDGHLEHPSVRYEKTDASLRAVLTIIGCAIALGILIFVLVYQFFIGYEGQLAVERKSQYPLAPTPSTALPSAPRLDQLDRLEGKPAVNVYARQKAKEDRLRGYGNTDEAGYVHIPIDEAMKHLADRLPVRKQEPAGPRHDLGLVNAGEPNSGRMFRKEP